MTDDKKGYEVKFECLKCGTSLGSGISNKPEKGFMGKGVISAGVEFTIIKNMRFIFNGKVLKIVEENE